MYVLECFGGNVGFGTDYAFYVFRNKKTVVELIQMQLHFALPITKAACIPPKPREVTKTRSTSIAREPPRI